MGFLKDCYTCFLLGFTGEYGRILEEIEKENTEQKPPVMIYKPPVPHYVLQQVEALTDQIETNNALLYDYDRQLETMYNQSKLLALEKKRHKLAYDTAKLEEKRYKLIEKYNLYDME